ncbi:MAG: WG repeat-containing protein [Flavobacteriaceae bacterium]|nr:WG repeat-containing protein [Bacteroidia bacterium]NNF74854.1 WG repeat-containing protein [Flavobacteriaceae bacterium]
MRRLPILLAIFFIVSICRSQDIEQLDFISPFHDGVAAVKKDKHWGFIDDSGTLIIDFRNDLVITKRNEEGYPIFNSGRLLFKEVRDGITYFGYLDKSGKAIIPARFLNATDFNDGWAVVLELVKRQVGTNELLEKPLVSYDYFEAIIDTEGKVLHYLVDKPVHIALDREYLRRPPAITYKVISNHLVAKLNENKTWSIKKIE